MVSLKRFTGRFRHEGKSSDQGEEGAAKDVKRRSRSQPAPMDIRVETVTETATHETLVNVIVRDLNQHRAARRVSITWRSIEQFKPLGRLGRLQWWGHWGVEVANDAPNDGYVWELKRGDKGDIFAASSNWSLGPGPDHPAFKKKYVGFTVCLTDTEIQTRASLTATTMQYPLDFALPPNGYPYHGFNHNCQQFAKALILNLAMSPGSWTDAWKRPQVVTSTSIAEDFFRKQPSIGGLPYRAAPVLDDEGQWKQTKIEGGRK